MVTTPSSSPFQGFPTTGPQHAQHAHSHQASVPHYTLPDLPPDFATFLQGHTTKSSYPLLSRLNLGLRYAIQPKALRKSFFRGVGLTLLSLPLAVILPGPQILVLPAVMGTGLVLRFLKGLRKPELVSHKLSQ